MAQRPSSTSSSKDTGRINCLTTAPIWSSTIQSFIVLECITGTFQLLRSRMDFPEGHINYIFDRNENEEA